jgi:hypothetical protein
MMSQRMGRFLSAVGAILLAGGLFLTWYHIDRGGGSVQSTTGWQTFTRLRFVILAGAALLLVTAILPQTRPVLLLRALIGLVLGVLILRRIVFPPTIADPVSSQVGVFVGLVGALAAVFGGIVDTGREVVERYPEMAFWRPPAGELGAGADPTPPSARVRRPNDPPGGAVVDSTADEI